MTEAETAFLPLFIAGFLTNMAYIGCLALLHERLRSPAVQSRGYKPPPLFSGTPVDLFRFLGFVFSDRHVEFDDPMTSRLVWATRGFLVVGLILTLFLFADLLSLI
ncbi:hypothetical protein [Brevundimonas sp.]|uniref:hypothetical protein n=1 Tax=Brevundimonas sp. TaxID=1871086 RepID=UPI002ABB2672|nr:hypothetical protein [Brevundimonas sp.]MDZ4363007.1 hypothetical protein [Brevundimonas sp.]